MMVNVVPHLIRCFGILAALSSAALLPPESSSTLPSPRYCMPHSSITHEEPQQCEHPHGVFPFLASLHWPQDPSDLGKFGTSCLVMFVAFEQNSGRRVLSEHFTRPHSRARRPLVAGGAIASNVIEIRKGCQFVHGQFRSFWPSPRWLLGPFCSLTDYFWGFLDTPMEL